MTMTLRHFHNTAKVFLKHSTRAVLQRLWTGRRCTADNLSYRAKHTRAERRQSCQRRAWSNGAEKRSRPAAGCRHLECKPGQARALHWPIAKTWQTRHCATLHHADATQHSAATDDNVSRNQNGKPEADEERNKNDQPSIDRDHD